MDRFTDQQTNETYRELDAQRQLWRERWYQSQRDLVDEIERGNRWVVIALFLGLAVGALFTASYMGEATQANVVGSLK